MDDSTVAALQEAVRLDPNNAVRRADLGRALLGQGRFPEAEAALREAVRLDPNNAAYRADLGQALLGQRRFPEAEAAFREAVRLDQDNADYRADLDRASRSYRRSRRIRSLAYGSRVIGVLLIVGVIVGVVLISIPDLDSQLLNHPLGARCPVAGPSVGLQSSSSGAQSVTAKLQANQIEEVDFGRSLISKILTIDLTLSAVPKGSAFFQVRTNPFLRADDAALTPQYILSSARRDGGTLILSMCFERNTPGPAILGDPGSYAGSVTIDDSRLSAPVTVPITVTMQYTNGVFLLWLFFAAVIPGAWCVWVLRTKRDGTEIAVNLDFLKWVGTVNGLVAVVAGGIAAFAVYTAVYLRDPTWGSSALQPLTLYGGMFSAFVTTSGLASLTGHKT